MPKKILLISNDFGVGGAQRILIDTIHELKRRGLKFKILTLKKELLQTLSGELQIYKNDWEFIDFGSLYRISSWCKVWKFIRAYKPDRVYCFLWMSNVIGAILSRLSGIRNIYIFEPNVYDQVKSRKVFIFDSIIQFLPKKIFASTEEVKESLVRHNILPSKIVVVHNSFNLEKYNIPKNAQLKNSLGYKDNDFIFLFVGRWVHQKAIDTLLNAFATFKKVTSASNAKLLLLGRGDQEQYLRQLAVDLGIVGEVNFLGIRNDIPDIMSFADCFVLASRHEGFPLVILEAMASKLPIVCTNFLGGRDIIHNGVEGLVTEVGDTTAFADSMKKIYENEVLRKELVKNASIKVQEFGIEKYVDKLLAL